MDGVLHRVQELCRKSDQLAPAILDVFLAVIILVGGIQLRNLSGVALPVTSSILAMIPFFSGCCCLLGLPAGIWALVVLSRPEVKTVIAWRRSGGYPPPGM